MLNEFLIYKRNNFIMKFVKTFEMFDSEYEKDKHEISYWSGDMNPEDIVKNDTKSTMFDSIELNDAITTEIPFFLKGNPQVMLDKVIYLFGDRDNFVKYTIFNKKLKSKVFNGEYEIETHIKKSGVDYENSKTTDFYKLGNMIEMFEGAVELIEKEFKINKQSVKREFGFSN